MMCDSKDVIYVILCAGCNKFNIDNTSNTLHARVRVLKQPINTLEYRQIHLNTHLESYGKNSPFAHFITLEMQVLSRNEKKKQNKKKHFTVPLNQN